MSALSYVIDIIHSKQQQKLLSEEIFFRGQREGHQLVPSLLRKHMKYKKSLARTENNFYCDAMVMGAKELSNVQDSWQALALFQHYEIPTRLLDWSSSLTSALFCARRRVIARSSEKVATGILSYGSSTPTKCINHYIRKTQSRICYR